MNQVKLINLAFYINISNNRLIMEWQQLIGFYETAKNGSYTEAAKNTLRTQSAVSQQVKSLEKEFNCSLFEKAASLSLIFSPGRIFIINWEKRLTLNIGR